MIEESGNGATKAQKLVGLSLVVTSLVLLMLLFKKDAAVIHLKEENLSIQRELLALHFQLLVDKAIISGQPKLAKSYLKTIDSLQPKAGNFIQLRLAFLDGLHRDSILLAEKLFKLQQNNQRALNQLNALHANKTSRDQHEMELLIQQIKTIELAQTVLEDSLVRLKTAYSRELYAHQQLTFFNKTNRVLYVGESRDSMANSHGTGLWQTGGLYTGAWKNNMRHGYGKYRWVDGESYEGQFANDRRNGQGTYYWKNGESYNGEWLDDRRNGYGEMQNSSGKVIAKGQWKDDQLIAVSGVD